MGNQYKCANTHKDINKRQFQPKPQHSQCIIIRALC